MEEIWKNIEGYEEIYQVSNMGRVKRLPYVKTFRNQFTSWNKKMGEYLFKPSKDSNGYEQVTLTVGRKRTAFVHRLVAEAFLQKPSGALLEECRNASLNYVLINHKDADRVNNKVENLEWCSPKHNSDHTVETGNHNPSKGEDNYAAILTEEQVLKLYRLATTKTMSQEKLGQLYGVKQITVSNIKTGRSWAWLTGHTRKERTTNKRKGIRIAECVTIE